MLIATPASSPETLAVSPGQASRHSLLPLVARLLALLCCCAAFWFNIQRAETLGMTVIPPVWIVDAIPPAVSSLLFGHQVRYTSLSAVSELYYREIDTRGRNAANIDLALAQIAQLDPAQVGAEYRLLGPEDKGIVDFVKAAFVVFGLHSRAVTYLYFAVLLASGVLLIVGTRADLAILVWIGSFLIAHALYMPLVTYNPQLGSYLALRAIPVMSMIACLHLLVFVLRPSNRPLGIALVVVQALLIVFTIHVRATTQWQVVTVGAVTVAALAVRWYLARETSLLGQVRQHAASVLPLAVLIAGMLALHVYRNLAYPAEYQRGDQILTRVFWHNVISGFAFHPTFAEREQLRIDDVSVARAVGRYLTAYGRSDEWVAVGGEARNLTGFRWAPYDLAARDYLSHVCRTEPMVCLSTTLYYKPEALLGLLGWSAGLRDEPPALEPFVSREWGDGVKRQMLSLSTRLHAEDGFARPWKTDALTLWGLLTAALALGGARLTWPSAVGSLAIIAGSTLTTTVGYPATWTIIDPGVATEAALYLLAALGVTWTVRQLPRLAGGKAAAQGQRSS